MIRASDETPASFHSHLTGSLPAEGSAEGREMGRGEKGVY